MNIGKERQDKTLELEAITIGFQPSKLKQIVHNRKCTVISKIN
ncbi:5300_t:CDS:2 [Gigaspora margarita]|uniref:5300_t:CDS:1 n=1 Tax=Gigaspora margarita TaxID=4874 RepID=A0ABM8VW83_GIGMA|nr:5300_t:CDS:2 [Gigaspora margarita]